MSGAHRRRARIARGASGTGRTVAAFDFDGTLTRRDSLLPFLARVRGWPRTLLALARVSPRYALVVLGRGGRDAVKERLLVALLAGIERERLARIGDAYGRELARASVTPEMQQRVAWHRDAGTRDRHRVGIVGCLPRRRQASALDAQRVLCTRLELDGNGTYTGRMDGRELPGRREGDPAARLSGRCSGRGVGVRQQLRRRRDVRDGGSRRARPARPA